MTSKPRYRVFVSYSHDWSEMAQAIVRHLREDLHLDARCDSNLQPGQPFTDEIKGRRETHESRLKRALHEFLPRERIERLIERGREQPSASFEWANSLELRTEMIVRGARWVRSRSGPAMIRQAAVLSSLSLPDKPPEDRVWDQIEGQAASSDHSRQLLAQERQILEEHAGRAGCKLLLFPWLNRESAGTERTAERIKVLIDGLRRVDATSGEGQKLVVVMEPVESSNPWEVKCGPRPRNLLIIGDWFAAESAIRLRGTGYQQTIATWHALTVWSWLEQFDARFDQLREHHLSPSQAIEKLKEIARTMGESPESDSG